MPSKIQRLLTAAPTLLVTAILAAPSGAADNLTEARRELMAGRYERAAALYSGALERQPEDGEAYYGLVRALIRSGRPRQALAVARQGHERAPGSAGALAAAGMAEHRMGDLAQAEDRFRAALAIDPDHAGALLGLGAVESAMSRFMSARRLAFRAREVAPDDPEAIFAASVFLESSEAARVMDEAAGMLDPSAAPDSSDGQYLSTITLAKLGRFGRLVTPYRTSTVDLVPMGDRPESPFGFGLRVSLNGGKPLRLLLDTGASGICVSPSAAKKAGLLAVPASEFKAGGIGDGPLRRGTRYVASGVRIGDVAFADVPIDAFGGVKGGIVDGLIGTDLFNQFLVRVDFVGRKLILEAATSACHRDPAVPNDAGPVSAGYHRVARWKHLLAIPTRAGERDAELFLIDSGAEMNLIDSGVASEVAEVYRDGTRVYGVQGRVRSVSKALDVDLVFGAFRQRNASLVAIDLKPQGDTCGFRIGGVLGMSALQHLELTIDYCEGTVRLRQPR